MFQTQQEHFLIMIFISAASWNVNATCPYLTEAPLLKAREERHLWRAGHPTSAQADTNHLLHGHAFANSGRKSGGTPNAQVAQVVQQNLPLLGAVGIFLGGVYSHLVSLNTVPTCCAVHMAKSEPCTVPKCVTLSGYQYKAQHCVRAAMGKQIPSQPDPIQNLLSTQSSRDPTFLQAPATSSSPIFLRTQSSYLIPRLSLESTSEKRNLIHSPSMKLGLMKYPHHI